ncbi:MAG TPA: Dyp-type peroxidase [Chloroflexota bacterium]
MPDLELDDIQGLIARGYPDLKAASYVLLHIDDASLARPWLRGLADQVTAAPARPSDSALNVALTSAALPKLGLPAETLSLFSNEFIAGMTTPHRRRMLGDLGPSAPENWLWGGPSTPAADVLLLLFARDVASLEQRYSALSAAFRGVSQIVKLDSLVDLDGKEHFGFADGMSQPTIDGLSSRKDVPPNTIKPGEFILGYINEYDQYTERPLVDHAADPGGLLPPDVLGSGKVDLARNGTYLVLRQLAQDVRGFWRFVDAASRDPDGSANPQRRTWLAAKMVGRWPSGAPLTLSPEGDDPRLSQANDFTYQYADEYGFGCPIGSHVRRAHPRDSLDPDPGTLNSVNLDKRHRLLRRGREYGPAIGDVFSDAPPDDAERGLYFVCLAANISRQFEFIQHTWVNNPKFAGLYDEPDPVVGYHPDGAANFSIPGEPVRQRLSSLPPFITTRGGGYFFLPGLRALRYLSTLAAGGVQPGKVSSPVGS